jgi:hypothetical protein
MSCHFAVPTADNSVSSAIVDVIRHQLTAFSLGASPSLLSDLYKHEEADLVPLSPEERRKLGAKVREVPEITDTNWKDHLGVQDAYSQYLTFFQKEIERLGTTGALDKYVFSEDAVSAGLAIFVTVSMLTTVPICRHRTVEASTMPRDPGCSSGPSPVCFVSSS